MLKSLQQRDWLRPLCAVLLAMITVTIIFTAEGITPFGNHNLLISDMGGQYLSFFTAYRHALLEHNFQLYSFSQSLGGSVVPTIAYYLMSPFNLIILLFSATDLPTGLSILIMIKIAAIAGTTTLFLQRHYRTTSWATCLFGLAFSLSGFVALNYFTIMWLDALIWLPLILIGLEHLIMTGRTAMFFWWLWISIVTNYYLGYMTCLFVICYFAYLLFEMKAPGTSLWQVLKQRAHLIRRVIVTALLSGISTLFLLIPTLLGMLQTAKSAVEKSSYYPTPQFGLSVLSQFGLGANNYVTRLEHDPTLFSTTLVTLLVLVFFVHPQIKRAHKTHVLGLLLVLFLSMAIRTLDTAWHMFQRPAGFPYREAFFFSFVMVMVAFEAWKAGAKKIARYWQWGLPLLLMGALVIGWQHQQPSTSALTKQTLMLSLGFVVITALILFTTRHLVRAGLLTGVVTAELVGNGILTMQKSPFGNQAVFQRAYQSEYRQMQAVNDPDGQLYRVENKNTLINKAYNYNSQYRNYNDPMLFNFHDITYYSSTFNNQTRLMLKSLGFFSKNARRVSAEGLNRVSAMLLGVKYSVTLNATGDASTKTLASHAGMGFAVPTSFTALTLHADSAIVNQEAILQRLRPSSTPYFANATIMKQQVKHDATAKEYPYSHTLWLKTNHTGNLYYDDPSASSKYTTMRVNDQLVKTKFNANGGVVLRNLGFFNKGSLVKLTVKTTHAKLTSRLHLASLDQAAFRTVYHDLQGSAFIPKYHASGLNTVVSGAVTNVNHRKWLYVAIPADTGWHVTVNGHDVTRKEKTVLGGMQAIPIQSGKNQVKMVYHVPGGHLGALISLLSLISFSGITWWWRRDRQA
ncbi:YfhO family protein [Lactiplantibacillus paraxiangfangensis]|uniref:YfhO family protein n=1 Tax=Lactiplantibacillus paraxiangfangensis TaxID=3076224 RepID=UPI0030C6E665